MGVKNAPLETAIPKNATVLLDTAPLIAYLQGDERISAAAARIVDGWIRTGRNRGIISVVSAMELLSGTQRAGQVETTILDFLQHFPNLRCVEIDLAVARRAASIRARTKLKTPDALIIASAVRHAAGAIVTNDGDWSKALPELPIVTLSEFA